MMRRIEFLRVAGAAIITPVLAEYAREVITMDPFQGALIESPTLEEVVVSKMTRPIMVRLANGKYTHDPDWTKLPYLPNFAGIQFTRIPGNPNLIPRRHGPEGLIDSIRISLLEDWPNKIDLTPDKPDIPWQFYYREGEDFVRQCRLAFAGTQSIIEGNESYEAAGRYVTGDQVIFTVGSPVPRNGNPIQTPLIYIMLQSF